MQPTVGLPHDKGPAHRQRPPDPDAAPRLSNHIPLGTLFGIRIWLSRWVLWLVLGIAFLNGMASPGLFVPTIAITAAVFGIVLLHELGHSVVAQHFGVRVSHITLWPLGGVAWMEEIPEDPRTEGLIAIAGPAVNFALAALAAPVALVAPHPIVVWFLGINLALGTFNLIPAFPMDGGRVLRALLALRYEWLEATEIAVRIGRTVALVGGVVGLMLGHFFAPFIAAYVWFMGQRELFAMRARKLGGAFPFQHFAEAARRAAAASGAGWERATDTAGAAPVHEQEASAAGGFSEEDIQRLEQHHGRLRRDWRESL